MEQKIIIVNKNDIRSMSFEEVYDQYIACARKIASKYSQYEFEDMLQEALSGLWKAYNSYDYRRGYVFMTLGYRAMENMIRMYCRNHSKYDKNIHNKCYSIYSSPNENDRIDYSDILTDNEGIVDDIITDIDLRAGISKLSDIRKRYITEYFILGYNYYELGRKYNVDPASIKHTNDRSIKMLKSLVI